MSEGNGNNNGAEWAQVFADFHARHKDKTGKKLRYTLVFNAAMDGFISCADIPLQWRILAWIWRQSWGNNSDWCVAGIGGKALNQADCAQAFGLSKQWVSDCFSILRDFNFVLDEKSQKIYPVDNPAGYQSESTVRTGLSAPNKTLFEEFCEEWKYGEVTYFQELESAEATVKRIRLVRLGHFRKWKRSRTSAGASLYPNNQPPTNNNNNVVAEEPPGPDLADDAAPPAAAPIAEKLEVSQETAENLLRKCQAASPGCTVEDVLATVDEVSRTIDRRNVRNPTGILLFQVPLKVAGYRARNGPANDAAGASEKPGPVCWICNEPLGLGGLLINGAHGTCWSEKTGVERERL